MSYVANVIELNIHMRCYIIKPLYAENFPFKCKKHILLILSNEINEISKFWIINLIGQISDVNAT